MSTIKFVPMEFFAQFALTQMRRLQARGAVGAAFPGAGRGWWAQVVVCGHGAAFMGMGRCLRALGAVGAAFWVRGGVGGRRSLFVRLSRRRVPIVNAGRCRCGFPGTGTSLADVGRCLRAWGAVGAAFLVRGRRWWAQVAACGMRRCLRTLVAVCAAFSGARERRPVLRTPPPFRAAHGACRSACPLAARPPPFRRAACRFAA